jgi:hypothetical protein
MVKRKVKKKTKSRVDMIAEQGKKEIDEFYKRPKEERTYQKESAYIQEAKVFF